MHPVDRQRFVSRSQQWRLGVEFFTDLYVCEDCGREQNRLVVNPLSVDQAERFSTLHAFRGRARAMMVHAITLGLIVRPDACERCGNDKETPQGHHYDYGRPLEVEWLCQKCHSVADDVRRAADDAAIPSASAA
jgi:hypothetical protein